MIAADKYQRFFPMLMTAAGTVKAARVVILGVGVAGLQAIATAKRLGAVIEASDVRPTVKEQVESLGAKFIDVPYETAEEKEAAEGVGGYARPMPQSWLDRQKVEVAKRVAAADIVITTALIPGRAAPVLVTEEMVKAMKPGSVIVDLAGRPDGGGNCPLTEAGQTVVKHGVTIVGETNLPALVGGRRVVAVRTQRARLPEARADQGRRLQRADGRRHRRRLPDDPGRRSQAQMPKDDHGRRLPTVINLIIFVLAIYVGYHVVWTVTPALHTPLMAVTNAISAIVIVGAMLAAALTETALGKTMGVLAVALAAVNIFGGFLVTRRMLEMFKKKDKKAAPTEIAEMSLNLVTLLYLVASICFIQALKGLSHPTTSIRGNLFGMVGMAIAVLTTAALIVKLHAQIAPRGRPRLGAARPGGRRRLRRLARQDGRDDQDARAGGVLPQHDRPGRGVHRRRRGGRALCLRHRPRKGRRRRPDSRPATGSSCSSARRSARSPSRGSVIAFGKLSGNYKFRLFKGAPVDVLGPAHAEPGARPSRSWPGRSSSR